MFCDVCGERSAVIYLTRIINGQKSEVNLCETCANKYKDELKINFADFSFENFWTNFADLSPFAFEKLGFDKTGFDKTGFEKMDLGKLSPQKLTEDITGDSCPTCGASYGDYRRTGRISCWDCYHQFADRLEPTLKRIHGNVSHQGKKPLKEEDELTHLRAELKERIEREEYEQAAVLRDQIRELELQHTEQE
jgi:protein arginine kinase activator